LAEKKLLFYKFLFKKEENFLTNFYSLPMMFGSNLKRREVIRGLDSAFVDFLAGIRGLGKEIRCRKFWFLRKNGKFFDTLSFYQVYKSLTNNPQTHHQGL
jgi:hypothetical protein